MLASFKVPAQALVVLQFILMNDLGLINRWGGIILPQLVVPVVIIVYKQFFDAVPKEMKEAVVLDGGGDYTLLFKVYLPLNWASRPRSGSSPSSCHGTHSCGHSWS